MSETNTWSDALRKRSLKATPNRISILDAISDYGKAIPYSKIQSQFLNLDRVTLYRTLNSLAESGLIHKVSVENDESFYAICSSQCTTHEHHHQHVHFKCTRCNEVTCVQSSTLKDLNIPGYEIDSFEIQAVGICKGCNQ